MLVVKIGKREVKSKHVQASSANEFNPCQSPVERNRNISVLDRPHSRSIPSPNRISTLQRSPKDFHLTSASCSGTTRTIPNTVSKSASSLRSKKLVINVIVSG